MLVDQFSRQFKYVRLSLTQKCNFRCSYCLPNGFCGESKSELSLNEITHLCNAFKVLGVEKIRLTGGEPALRHDLVDIVRVLRQLVGIKQVAVTTNGFNLHKIAGKLKAAGLSSLNISLDSLQAQKFQKICGLNFAESIKSTIEQCLNLGFESLKINTVLLRGINEDEFSDFIEYVRTRNLTVRFIELMQTANNAQYFSAHHVANQNLIRVLELAGWSPEAKFETAGPARVFRHPKYLGRIGFISPYSKDFCSSCNRLRVTSTGALRLCLFGEGSISLREHLHSANDHQQLLNTICLSLGTKLKSHNLHNNQFGDMNTLSAIGG